jgi:membrane associated rhomboid family serine protease
MKGDKLLSQPQAMEAAVMMTHRKFTSYGIRDERNLSYSIPKMRNNAWLLLATFLTLILVLLPHSGCAFQASRTRVHHQPETNLVLQNSLLFETTNHPARRAQQFATSFGEKSRDSRRRTQPLLQQLYQSYPQWEGDDIRWLSKLRRNARQRSLDFTKQPMRNLLLVLNVAAYAYQTINSVNWIQTKYPAAWPSHAVSIVWDTVTGNSRPGPFTMAFVHSAVLSAYQPHRYLTAGFLHGSIFHLLLNMNALRQLPAWLETGLGAPLYLTTILAAIVAGNLAHTATALDGTLCLGASGGICGLYGLLYVSLVRMGNHAAAWRVMKGMGILLVVGAVLVNVSNAGHAGGLVAGIVLGILSGPRYRKSYSLRRKNSLEVDLYSRDYRAAMGFDKVPSERGIIPLPLLWVAVLVALATQPKFRIMPRLVLQGLLDPGSLTGLLRS